MFCLTLRRQYHAGFDALTLSSTVASIGINPVLQEYLYTAAVVKYKHEEIQIRTRRIEMANNEQPKTADFSTESSALLSSQAVSADADEIVWNELDKPWPSTFGRSISLLASPIQPRKEVEKYTKSPKPGRSPIALRIRAEGNTFPTGARHERLNKTHSLDLLATDQLDVANRLQELKMEQARQYRAKILEAQNKSQETKRRDSSKSSFSQCVFNLVNILMGVGLLGLPYVFKCAGWLGGSLCLLLFATSAWRTSILIARELNTDPRPCHQITRVYAERLTSFPEIARTAFGDFGCIMLSSVLYFELFSCVCVLLVAMGDHLNTLYPSISFNVHTSVAAAVSLIPTVLLRTPSLLSYLSLVGTCTTLILVLAVVLNYVVEGDISDRIALRGSESGPLHQMFNSGGILTALGMISYCFSGHAIVPAIYSSMEKPQQFEGMVSVAFVIVVVSCFAVAFSGYLMFGTLVEEEVTLSLQQHSSAASVMLCITWLMIFTCASYCKGFVLVSLTLLTQAFRR